MEPGNRIGSALTRAKKKVNGLPCQSNQNRMIPCPLSPKLLEVKYAAYCTIVSPLRKRVKGTQSSHQLP